MGDFPSNTRIRPVHGGVLVKVIELNRASGRIIVPKTSTERPIIGRVEETSPGHYQGSTFCTHQVHVGDIVVFPYNSGFDVFIDHDEYRIVKEIEIVAILNGGDHG